MKVSYNITQNKFNVSFKTGYYPLPVGLENYYTKNETDLLLENYYLKTETYTQDEVDSLFSNETLDAITDRWNTTENDIKVGGVTTDYVQLDTTSTNTYNIGKVFWNSDKGTYNFGLLNNVELQLGQEQYVYGKAYSAISNGQLVMYRTSQGGHILFEPANFTQLSTNPDLIIGVATQDIALNNFGYITTFGEVNTLNTSSFVDGGTLYFGSGNVLQNTAPTGSYFIVGRVNRSHATQGSIFVKPYFVDGNLESKSNKSDSYTSSSSTTYASTKALVDGLATKADLADGKVPSSQLPSYVDDVLEFANLASFPTTGESGKIYIAIDTNITYRWSGTGYAEISASLALGETASTAYRGDRGKIAFDHSQTTGNPHGTTKSDIGLGNVDNTSDLNKPISTATQTALNSKLYKGGYVGTAQDLKDEIDNKTSDKYNDESNSIANDIIKFIDINTGENVNYRETTTWYDGSAMDDSKVDGIFYEQFNGKFYKREFSEIDIRWSGAVGDGNTDDTIKLQKLIDNTPEGGVLTIKQRYMITSPLIISKPITLRGVRGNKSFIIANGCDAIKIKSSDVLIENLKVGHAIRYTNENTNSFKGIVIAKDNNARIDRVRLINTFVDGFETAYEVTTLWDSEFVGIKSYATKFGFVINGQSVNNEISNNSSFNCTSNGGFLMDSVGIKFSGIGTEGEGWRITNVLVYGAMIGVFGTKMSHVTIQSCMFDFCQFVGVYISDSSYNWNISNTYIAMTGQIGNSAILLANAINTNWVRGNKIVGNDILVYEGSNCVKGIDVVGNGSLYDHIDNNSIKGFTQIDIEARTGLQTTIVNNKCLSAITTNIIGNYITENNIGNVYYQLLKDRIKIGKLEISYSNTKPNPDALSNTAIVFNSEPNVGEPIGWVRSDFDGGYKSFGIIKEDFREKGTTAERPTYVSVGFQYFDTTILKPIWAKDTSNPTSIIWIDSNGNTV